MKVTIETKPFIDMLETDIEEILKKTYDVELISVVERNEELNEITVLVSSDCWETDEEEPVTVEDELTLTPNEIIYSNVFDANEDEYNEIYEKFLLAKGYHTLLKNNEFCNEFKELNYCANCGKEVDIEKCRISNYWSNYGNNEVFHICPHCGKQVEPTYSAEDFFFFEG